MPDTADQFTRRFWNICFENLTKMNSEMPDVFDSKDNFIQKIDDLACEYELQGFGYKEHIDDIKFDMQIVSDEGKRYSIKLRADIKPMGVKGSYLELNRLLENKEVLCSNVYLPFLPYSALENLFQSFGTLQEDYEKALLDFNKAKKLSEMNVAIMKSLLTEKFRNTRISWDIAEVSSSYIITLSKNNNQLARFIVGEDDFMQKIEEFKLPENCLK